MAREFRKPMTWLHTWSGVIVGWLLFAIFVTGTSSYYRGEVTLWMQPETHKSVVSEKTFDIALSKALQATQSSNNVTVTLPNSRTNMIAVKAEMKNKGGEKKGNQRQKRKRIPSLYYDASTGELITPRATAGGNFLYRFHFELYNMPRKVAHWIVGIATMSMLVAIITGIIIHTRIFKDIFTFRSKDNTRGWMDAHILPGVATLPFLIMITYSGLLLLNSALMPWGAKAHYGDDIRAYKQEFRALYTNGIEKPTQPQSTATKTDLTKVQLLKVLYHKDSFAVDNIGSFNITQKKPNSVTVEIVAKEAASIFSFKGLKESKTFDLYTHEQINMKNPPLSKSTIVNVNSAFISLHMAHFADSTLRFVFFVGGVFGIILSGTGLVLWIQKRKKKNIEKKSVGFWLVEKLNLGTMAGIFIAIGVYFIANRFISAEDILRKEYEINAFFLAWLLSYIHAFFRDTLKAWREQLLFGSLLFLSLPVINASIVFDSLSEFYMRDAIFIYFDIFFVFMAIVLAFIAKIVHKKAKAKAQKCS
ncbi:MAG: PepSY-associated TM helix domain-containing protein [Arcobacteraceae bacterium]